MLNTTLRKKVQVLALILVMLVFLAATTALAATEFIEAKTGGSIRIARGVWLVIPPRALEEDTVVSAYMIRRRDRVNFIFEPSGLIFRKPAELKISWQAIAGMGGDDLTLYGEGMEIEPIIRAWGVVYPIEHFSLYYHRRR